jgi:hypothetical protein
VRLEQCRDPVPHLRAYRQHRCAAYPSPLPSPPAAPPQQPPAGGPPRLLNLARCRARPFRTPPPVALRTAPEVKSAQGALR